MLEASTSWNPQDLSRPVEGLLYLSPGYEAVSHPEILESSSAPL
jgi:hypothetical protein